MGNLGTFKGVTLISFNPIVAIPSEAKIQGESQLNGDIQSMRLMLIDQRNGNVIRHWYTGDNGIFDFNVSLSYIGYNYLTLISYPDDGIHNAAIISDMQPTYINA